MNLEEQVCSLDLAKRLKEFGVKHESAFYWVRDTTEADERWVVNDRKWGYGDNISAFTVAEFGEMLPKECITVKHGNGYGDPESIWVASFLDTKHREPAKTEADARAKMLIHLIEKGIIQP